MKHFENVKSYLRVFEVKIVIFLTRWMYTLKEEGFAFSPTLAL